MIDDNDKVRTEENDNEILKDCLMYNNAQVYKNALDVRLDCFGSENLQVAVAHEDLAYATYVNEYSTGEYLTNQRPVFSHVT